MNPKHFYRIQVVNFTVATYRDYNQHCLQGNVWSYDSTFLFVGSVATTIGYGNVTPKTREELFSTNRNHRFLNHHAAWLRWLVNEKTG